MKLAPETHRDEIVKTTFTKYEKEVTADRRDDAITKLEVKAERSTDEVKPEVIATEPEFKEATKTTSVEKAAVEQIKPTLKVRDFEAIGREKLIAELVAAARDEAREWKGEDLSYKQEKRLTKMYRENGDIKPFEKQLNDLKNIQDRFGELMPQPKNFLEATVLKLDNITDTERSASLRGQLTKLDELIEREEAQKLQSEKPFGHSVEGDVFGRTDSYFTQQLHRLEMKPEGKSYFELTREAQERDLMIQSYSVSEKMQEQQTQQAIYQMGISNALQEQIKKSLDEQGIKLEPLAQRIINNTVDTWAKQQPTAEEYKSVQEINQSSGHGLMPESKLEAKAYIFTQSDERERDQISYSLAKAASKRAEEVKQAQAIEREKSIEMERDYEDYSQGRSM